MHIDWNRPISELPEPLRELRGGTPDVMQGCSAIAQAASKANALVLKTEELIALAISIAIRCDDRNGFHAKAAVEQGASREKVLETLEWRSTRSQALRHVCEPRD
jgi:AhpD family alkylhydroperoxidase